MRSSGSHFVKASGLRWISLMLLTTIPWADRTWALPVLTALAPSERLSAVGADSQEADRLGAPDDSSTPSLAAHRPLVIVADSSYAALDARILSVHDSSSTFITRLRLDAALYEPAPPRVPVTDGAPRLQRRTIACIESSLNAPMQVGPRCLWPGTTAPSARWRSSLKQRSGITRASHRCPSAGSSFETPYTSSTHKRCCVPAISPAQIVDVVRAAWQIEVTFQETRAHLGVETQRQWSDRAISRTTPVLLNYCSPG